MYEQIEVNNGITISVLPSFNPTLTAGFFGVSCLTIKYNQLYQYDFDFSLGWSILPSTLKNIFPVVLFSKKTCLNAL
jgi:hypothetical protein